MLEFLSQSHYCRQQGKVVTMPTAPIYIGVEMSTAEKNPSFCAKLSEEIKCYPNFRPSFSSLHFSFPKDIGKSQLKGH